MKLSLQRSFFSAFAALLLIPASYGLANTVVFSDDFDGGQTIASGVTAAYSGVTTTEPVQDYAGLGPTSNQFSGDFLRNKTGGLPSIGTAGSLTTLTLSNLPSHTAIDLDFLLATIDSWDGIDGTTGVTGDYFNVRVDGVEVFEATFAQLSGTSANAYQAPSGGQLSAGSDLFDIDFINDGAYDMGIEPGLSSISHTSSTLVIDIFADGPGWQGEQPFTTVGLDESWAIDNVRVTVIPEPSSTGLFCIAPVVFGLLMGRRRRS